MLLPTSLLGVFLALTSAFLGGSGDFIGGRATRRSGPLPVLAWSNVTGLGVMLLSALGWREAWPSPASVGWAAAAGIVGVLGMTALYRGLSLGQAARVAPTSGVIAAAVPVVFAIFAEGWPSAARLAGFALALLGIWLVSQPATPAEASVSRPGLWLAVAAGLSFGTFFILLGQVQRGLVFMPLVVARSTSLATVWLLLRGSRVPLTAPAAHLDAWFIGLVDSFGTALYVLARQYTRLDVAAVLVSLYPAVTVLLAWLISRETVSRRQWLGAAFCLAAVGLITI